MITKVLGPLVFAVTLIAGITVSSFIPLVQSVLATLASPVTKPLGLAPEYKTYADGKIEIEYLGEKSDEGRPYLHFRIINRTETAVTYTSEFGNGPEIHEMEIDGFRPELWWCGTGQETRLLYSGYAVDAKVFRFSIDERLPDGGADVRIGYYIRGLDDERKLVFSRPFWLKPNADDLDWEKEAASNVE